MIPLRLMWCLWLERNSRCFEDKERSLGNLSFSFFLFFLYIMIKKVLWGNLGIFFLTLGTWAKILIFEDVSSLL